MSNSVKCSVIIPTYNRVTLLRHTLESLTRQSLPREQFEVLVVDDGSSDTTSVMVNDYRERLDLHYFFQEDEGWRLAKARNVGIANAAADICVLIDSGIMLHSGCLAAHVASHDDAPEPVAVCGYVYASNVSNRTAELITKDIDFQDPDATIERMAAKRHWLDHREEFYAKYTDDFHDLPAPWVIFWTFNVSVGTKLARSVGGFDEAFQSWGGEDMEFGYRLYNSGAKFILNRRASSIHSPHLKKFRNNHHTAMHNHRYIAAKYGTPITQLFLNFPIILPNDMTGVVTPFNMNDIIRERGLPACADYLAQQAAADAAPLPHCTGD
jgi:glycosyltransferase involved in cell wall biosynthesis